MNEPLSQADVHQLYQELRVRFIEAELELAVTFCDVARMTEHQEVRERNIANAQKAAETAINLLQDQAMSSEDALRITSALQELHSKLDDCQRKSSRH